MHPKRNVLLFLFVPHVAAPSARLTIDKVPYSCNSTSGLAPFGKLQNSEPGIYLTITSLHRNVKSHCSNDATLSRPPAAPLSTPAASSRVCCPRLTVYRSCPTTSPLHSTAMLRSLPRGSALALRTSIRASSPATVVCKRAATVNAHAISNPTLAGIEKRWEAMQPTEQAELWMALRDRMKVDWHQMTLQEKKAAYWIAFGPHGPRSLPPPGEGWMVFRQTMAGVAISAVIFYIVHSLARPAPGTMTKEYQEMTNEYLKNQNTEPITGVSSEGYKGKGMVQSGPKRAGH